MNTTSVSLPPAARTPPSPRWPALVVAAGLASLVAGPLPAAPPRLTPPAAAPRPAAAALPPAPVSPPPPAAATPAPAAEAPRPANKPKEFTLTRRSGFEAGGANPRNPFLPIGYVRPKAIVAEAPKEVVPDVRPEQFVVTSFSLEPPPLAVINGRTYAVGERIPVNATGTDYVTVRAVVDGAVVLDYRGRSLRCESRRKR